MDPSPSMVHLAMAAFFGASIMAISALFIHKRSVDQILERLIEVRRKKAVYRADRLVDGELEEEEEHMGHVEDENGVFHDVVVDDNDDDDEIEISGQVWSVQSAGGENMNLNMISSYGISSSVPNVVGFSNDWLEDDSGNRCLSSSLDKSHLPLLQRYLRSGNFI